MPNEPKALPTVCGHQDPGGVIVQYSATGQAIHSICRSCYRKGIYYTQPIEGVDLLLEGGYSIEIEV